jgi:hypothetical protein
MISPTAGAVFVRPQPVPFRISVPACCPDGDQYVVIVIANRPYVTQEGLLPRTYQTGELHTRNFAVITPQPSERLFLQEPRPTQAGEPAFYEGAGEDGDFGSAQEFIPPEAGGGTRIHAKPADNTYYWQVLRIGPAGRFHSPVRKVVYHFQEPLPRMTAAEARKYTGRAIKLRRSRAKGVQMSGCVRLSDTSWRCSARWRERGRRYRATIRVWFVRENGELLWDDKMSGLRRG